MSIGICHISHVPGRAEPSDTSEMTTQILFGESFIVLEKKSNWTKIQLTYDNYKCWICNKQYLELNNNQFDNITNSKNKQVYCTELISTLTSQNGNITIVLGSTLPLFNGKHCFIQDKKLAYYGHISEPFLGIKNLLIDSAMLYLNAPYLWGGRSPFGIDCSGFTQMVYKLNGIRIPRDASEQAKIGQSLSFIEEAEPGDLAFFDNTDGNIIHVGLILEHNKIIHASGKVRIDNIDHQGIYNQDITDYSHKLRIIKRII